MGLLDLLFGKPHKKHASHSVKGGASGKGTRAPEVSLEGRFMSVDTLEFFGPYSRSPSGRWVLGWSDADRSSGTGGHRKSGNGRYILYDAESRQIVVRGNRLQRPNGGSVADTGTFSLEDWHFASELSGTLYVFSPQGETLFKRNFTANLFNSGISQTGRYAASQTANSATDDGNKLCFFDVANRKELFSVSPIGAWADQYEFDEERGQLIVYLKDLGKFRYDMAGNFLDSEKLQECSLNSESFYTVVMAVENLLKESDVNLERARIALDSILRAKTLKVPDDQTWQATALKLEGLAHEILGEYPEAIAAFESALRLNPKVGVKRKLETLRKKHAT